MKNRIISLLLLLSTLLCLVSCEGTPEAVTDTEKPTDEESTSVADSTKDPEPPTNLLNLAATNEEDEPLYSIVHKMGAENWLIEQCAVLAAEIYDVTGVMLPIVHEMEKSSPYEIMIGDVIREETVEIRDSMSSLKKTDFKLLTVGKRVWIYAKSDQAIATGITLLTHQFAERDVMARTFTIAEDFEYLYQPSDNPPVSISDVGERHVEIELQNTAVLSTLVRLTHTENGGWRLQSKYLRDAEYNDLGAAQRLAYSLGESYSTVTHPLTTVTTGTLLTVTAPDGSRAEIRTDTFSMDFYTPVGTLAATVTDVSANPAGSSIAGKLIEGEAIYGTGERFNAVNQRGQYIEMFSKDIWSRADACYMVIPLLCSSRGSGIFINLYEHMVLDLGKEKEDEWRAAITGAQIDTYIFTTEEIPEAITAYSDLTGYAGLPEEWTYGMLVCSIGPEFSQKWSADITPSADGRGEGIYEMIANMEAYDLPWTGVLAEAWGPYHVEKHKDLKELCDYVHSLGKKFLVYIRVGSAHSGMQTDVSLTDKRIGSYSQDYLVKQTLPNGSLSHNLPDTSPDTNNPDVSNPKSTHVYLDVTNPEAVKWFFDEYWDYLTNDVGVDGCKIDFCETLPENYKLNYYDKTIPTAGSHHWYPTAFCAMFWDMLEKKPDGGMCYTRGGGIGSQRAPYMWAGDQMRYWNGITFQLKAVLSSGLSGVPFMSYDMSGYQQGNVELHKRIDYEAPVFLRGTQYSAFTLCIQTHGRNIKRSYQFAKEYPMLDAAGNEVLDEDGNTIMIDYTYVTEIYRAYTKLHEHLTPYITELCREATTTGMPAMRHMILEYGDDENVYEIEDAYMFGDAFLIAPILNDQNTRDIYLPEGNWLDLNTGEEIIVPKGGKWIENYETDLATLPSFFNQETDSQIARDLVPGIMDLYDYARSLLPADAS